MGRGYSFEVMRARLIYEKQARKPTTKLRERKPKGKPQPETLSRSVGLEKVPRTVEYGAHIPTLCELLESGHFS